MAGEIQREVSRLVREEIKDPRVDNSRVSVTRVDVSHDGSHARIYLSVMGSEEEGAATIKVLKKAAGFLRSGIARTLKIKNAPEIDLRLDRSIEQGIRISSMLAEVVTESAGEEKETESE